MSNVDNEGLRTLDQVRGDRAPARIDTTARLNPGQKDQPGDHPAMPAWLDGREGKGRAGA